MRSFYNEGFKADIDPNIDVDVIVENYQAWVKREVFLLLQKIRPGKKSLFRRVPAAKRGDPVYVARAKARFKDKTGHIPDYDFFSKRDRGVQRTNLIFVTMTYANQDMSNWLSNGKHFQEFANRLRSTYGKIEFLRVWESHWSGQPHSHAVIRLEKSVYCRRINGEWRVIGKEFKRIKGYWTHGISDIVALNGTREVTGYLGKYVTKAWTADEGKHVKTLAMLWYFQKRAFSFSKRFFEDCRAPPQAAALSTALHNSYDVDLNGNRVENYNRFIAPPDPGWTYVGVFGSTECQEIIEETWEFELFQLRSHGLESGLESWQDPVMKHECGAVLDWLTWFEGEDAGYELFCSSCGRELGLDRY